MSILNFNKNLFNKSYLSVSILGNIFKLNIKYTNINNIELNKKTAEIDLFLPNKYKNYDNMDVINLSIKKLYNEIAVTEIEYAMEIARHLLKFAPEDYKIERLDNTFFKCSKNKVITINPDIVQYSREVINVTIIQAFCKMKFKPNSENYKKSLKNALIKYEENKKLTKLKLYNEKIS